MVKTNTKKGNGLVEILVIIGLISFFASFITMVVSEVNKHTDSNYKICGLDDCYYVESYTKENQGRCVYMSENETRICGDFIIENIQKQND